MKPRTSTPRPNRPFRLINDLLDVHALCHMLDFVIDRLDRLSSPLGSVRTRKESRHGTRTWRIESRAEAFSGAWRRDSGGRRQYAAAGGRRMKTRTLATVPALGSVHSDELLPQRVFCQRLGIEKKAWAALARRGFPIIRSGKQAFIDGAAALAYFRALGEQQSRSRNENASNCDNVVCVQQLNQTNNFLGEFQVRFSQTNSNAGDVNNAVAEKGTAIQTIGAGNKVQVQEPKGSGQDKFWEMVRSLWNWAVRMAQGR